MVFLTKNIQDLNPFTTNYQCIQKKCIFYLLSISIGSCKWYVLGILASKHKPITRSFNCKIFYNSAIVHFYIQAVFVSAVMKTRKTFYMMVRDGFGLKIQLTRKLGSLTVKQVVLKCKIVYTSNLPANHFHGLPRTKREKEREREREHQPPETEVVDEGESTIDT